MRTASRTTRVAGAILLPACLSMAAGVPAAHADYDAGKQALAAGQPGKAAAQWRGAAEAGDARSMLELGCLLVQGLGIVQNYVEAHKWFDLAASLDQSEATKERDAVAAKMTSEQLAEARKRTVSELRAAAARGLPQAMLALGRLYVRGVPAGSFTMGSPESEEGRDEDEGPQRRVTIAKPFAVGKYEVTRAEFARFVKETEHSTGNSCNIRDGGFLFGNLARLRSGDICEYLYTHNTQYLRYLCPLVRAQA